MKNVPHHAYHIFQIENYALVDSENHEKWAGPFVVTYVDGRNVTVKTLDETHKYFFKSSQLKLYFKKNQFSNSFECNSHSTCMTEVIARK